MILDRLENASRYLPVLKGLDAAFAFLSQANLAELAPGRHDLAPDWVHAMVIRGEGNGTAGAKLEAHRKYLDIQYVVEGTDLIGWKTTAHCTQPEGEFDEEKDFILYTDPPDAWVALAPGTYAILFPEDAHAPMAGEGPLHKIVVKVRVE